MRFVLSVEENVAWYIGEVHKELIRKGVKPEKVPGVIAKTGFMKAIEEYPEAQLHLSVEDAVDERYLQK